MNKIVFGAGFMLCLFAFFAVAPMNQSTDPDPEEETINWMSWEEAQEAMEAAPKKMFIDVYTEWCGWCKRMDANTFTDADVISFMNENYYAVKLDAEGEGDKEYLGKTLAFRSDAGRRGVHELAIVLLNGRLGYPSFVYLAENQESLKVSPGYKTPEVILEEMRAVAKTTTP